MPSKNMSFDELIEVNKELESQKIAYESQLKSYESRISQMQFQIDEFRRLFYGAKRERFIPNQDENQMTLP